MCINEQELTKDSYDDDDFLHTARSDTHHGLHTPLQITAHLSWTSAMLSIHLWTSTLAPYNLLLIYPSGGLFQKCETDYDRPLQGFPTLLIMSPIGSGSWQFL